MSANDLELATVLATYESDFRASPGMSLSFEQERVIRDIVACRTATLGGHLEICDACGFERPAYNSCRNRHCPKCQATARARWMAAQAEDLLPVEYFHVVFTLPQELGPLALQNKRCVYGLLFQAVSETLLTVAADPKRLGARIGFLAILHTWGQNLGHHPHVHCVVPGGGLSPDGTRWIPCRPGFFLPVRVLSRVFRGKFLSLLECAYRRGKLGFHGQLENLAEEAAFRRLLKSSAREEWVVYAKPPFGGPEQVLKYLARYTHRVAISNQRLLSCDNGLVRFKWKDYRAGNQWKTMTLPAVEFIRRFLLHVLPRGFMRIRHYGFLANAVRRARLTECRQLLGQVLPRAHTQPADDSGAEPQTPEATRCPSCQEGHLRRAGQLRAQMAWPMLRTTPAWNTS